MRRMPESIFSFDEISSLLQTEQTLARSITALNLGSAECKALLTTLMCHQAFAPCLKLADGVPTPQLICRSFCQKISTACADIFDMAAIAGLLEMTVQCEV